MTENASSGFAATFKSDLLASLVVFMVALPLCIAIAGACGLPPEVGIISGIVGGLVVGPLAGSPLQVSGPAAGLIVLVLDVVLNRQRALATGETSYSVLIALGVIVFLVGLLQLLMAALRLGHWFRAVSPAVVLGMLSGIGVVIFAKQVHNMIDDEPDPSVARNLISIPSAFYKAFAEPEHRTAASAGVVTLFFLVFWKTIAPRVLRLVPAALSGVVAGTLVAEIFGLSAQRITVQANLLDGVTWIQWHSFVDLVQDPWIWRMAIAMALIASAETLLCATAIDQMHRGPRTHYNRELAAQGVGNLVSGILGAMPMTGVIVRSTANVTAGAKTRWSATMHGLWLLLFVAVIPDVLRRIPDACLAAVLVYTGFKLFNWQQGIKLWKESRSECLIFVVTLLGVVFTDLLTGVLVGVILTAGKLIVTMSHLNIQRTVNPDGKEVTLILEGAATFMNLPKLAQALETVPPGWTVHVYLDHLLFIDHSCLHLLAEWEKQHEATGGRLTLDQDGLRARFDRARVPRWTAANDQVTPPAPPALSPGADATLVANGQVRPSSEQARL